jgi:hypothetical protein
MKPHIFYLIALNFVLWSFSGLAQTRPFFPKVKRDVIAIKPVPGSDNVSAVIGSQKYNPTVSVKSALDDPSTMVTTYDLQTNASDMARIYRYPDATIGAISTWSAATSGATFPDRGTGYNYFNGSSWGAQPTGRIETTVRTGWPSYAPLGANGEITIAHNVTAGASLVMSTRNTKGSGTWTVTQPAGLGPPSGAAVMSWPKMVTNGNPRSTIHIIALTEPVASGGTTYLGMDGALLYNRSSDGGSTWTGWQQLPGMTSAEYKGFSADSYNWAEPKGDTICFVVGGNWSDEFIMKSTNNGNSWTKTKIWTCPYDLWPGNVATDTFYCSDGSNAVALDHNGKAHVAFGRQRALGDNTGAKFYFPFTDGLIYWDETMAELPQTLDADNIFIGWVKDTMVFYQAATQLAYYYTSMSSFPTMVIDNNDNIFVVYSSVTLLLDPNSYMLRHLFARASIDDGVTWRDSLVEITSNFFQYHFEECVYPSASPTSTDSLFVLFQGDVEGGVYLNGSSGAQGQTDITNNDIILIKPAKSDIIMWGVGLDQKKNQPSMLVSQNAPNPFKDQTLIDVQMSRPGPLVLDVYAVTGQNVLEIDKGTVGAGTSRFILHSSQLKPGVYFYTVRSNDESSTRKMIVE